MYFILVKRGLDFKMWLSNLNSENATHKMHYCTSVPLNVNACWSQLLRRCTNLGLWYAIYEDILFWIDIYCNCKKERAYQAHAMTENVVDDLLPYYYIKHYGSLKVKFCGMSIYALSKNLWIHSKNRNVGSNILQNRELLISVLIKMIGFQNAISVCNGWTGNNHISRTIQTETQSI